MTDRLADQPLHGVSISGIEAQSDCVAADLVRRRLCCFLDEVGANHLCAFRSETLSRCRSDASAATCDDRHSFLKALHVHFMRFVKFGTVAAERRKALTLLPAPRSEERRLGTECVSTGRSRWVPD